MEAERMEVNEVAPHFPTIPADFEAETPAKIPILIQFNCPLSI